MTFASVVAASIALICCGGCASSESGYTVEIVRSTELQKEKEIASHRLSTILDDSNGAVVTILSDVYIDDRGAYKLLTMMAAKLAEDDEHSALGVQYHVAHGASNSKIYIDNGDRVAMAVAIPVRTIQPEAAIARPVVVTSQSTGQQWSLIHLRVRGPDVYHARRAYVATSATPPWNTVVYK